MLKYLGGTLGVAALLFAGAVTPAQAAERCFGAGAAGAEQYVCFDVQPGWGESGTTVAPFVSARCGGSLVLLEICSREGLPVELKPDPLDGTSIGTTGFVPNPYFEEPCVDAQRGTIRSAGGTLGTLYVDGVAIPVDVPPFYLGDPSGC